ncbi:hypothetical protein VCHA54O482_30030 [Vibrio chagasii]|nr:hypothetical protein VCHA28FP16_220053 [Vibrio chagasii]CAH7418840.1 hypothetical protein VCHA54O482_30030 [Vibrio chagasii]
MLRISELSVLKVLVCEFATIFNCWFVLKVQMKKGANGSFR